MKDLPTDNEAVVDLRTRGMMYREISDEIGRRGRQISRQRAQQICGQWERRHRKRLPKIKRYTTKNCRFCGEPFAPHYSPRQYICSNVCAALNRQRSRDSARGRSILRCIVLYFDCDGCGKFFVRSERLESIIKHRYRTLGGDERRRRHFCTRDCYQYHALGKPREE